MRTPRILAMIVLALSGCEQVKRIDDEGSGGTIPRAVQEAFDRQCNDPTCHGEAPALGLSLVAANSASILDKNGVANPELPYVEFGDVPGSFMGQKLLSDSTLMELGIPRIGDRMPNVSITPEIQQDVAIILGWIAGAELPGGGGAETGGTGTDSGSMTEGGTDSGGTTGPVEMKCGIEDLAPGSPTDLIEAGDGAMQIPTEIGVALANNCGCHYVDDLNRQVTDYAQGSAIQPMVLATWADWRTPYGMAMKSPIDESRVNLADEMITAMPPPLSCDVGTGVHITDEDKTLLLEWLDAGAPDGASWAGGGSTGGSGSTSG